MSNKLEPCPFCGGEVKLYRNGVHGFFHLCTIDGDAMVKIESRLFGSDEEAIEVWNRRVGAKMIDLATMLSKDESNEDKVKKQCSYCKWRLYEDITQQMICNNYWSENFKSIIDGSDTCIYFELDKNIFWTNNKKYFGKPLKVGNQ